MKKLERLKANKISLKRLSVFNGGVAGDTPGATGTARTGCYSCDYVQPDGSGTIYHPDVYDSSN